MSERINPTIKTHELLMVTRSIIATHNPEIAQSPLIRIIEEIKPQISLPKTGAQLRELMGITASHRKQDKHEVQRDDKPNEGRRGNPASPDILDLYLKELTHPLLTASQEVDLAKKYEGGKSALKQLKSNPDLSPEDQLHLAETINLGQSAKQTLIESNLRLVVKVARKYYGRGLPLTDLIQEGGTGLIKGIEKYDWRKGYRVSTYAFWWIRQSVSRAVAEHSRTIRLPIHMGELANKVYRSYGELAQKLEAEPTNQHLADYLELPKNKIDQLMAAYSEPISLESPAGKNGDATLGDFVSDPGSETALQENAEKQELHTGIEQAFIKAGLSEREAAAVRLRFGIDDSQQNRTLQEVGEQLGVSRERARQLEAEALRKLRHPRSNLKKYLA